MIDHILLTILIVVQAVASATLWKARKRGKL